MGADGSGEEIDCIHLVYVALEAMEIPTPAFKDSWYEASRFAVIRDLREWGELVGDRTYTGDVAVFRQNDWTFGVVWRDGILHISPETERVSWCGMDRVKSNARFYRLKSSYATS
ncbi:MAG: hypothetical protein ACO23G_10725 [Limnohabitans sp.]